MSDEERKDREQEQQQSTPELEQESAETESNPLQSSGGKALADALKVSFRFLKIAMVVLVVVFLLRGIFDVKQGEVQVKMRFGQPVQVDGQYVLDSESGLHLCWPWEEVKTIPVTEQVMEMERAFWYFVPPGGQRPPAVEGLNVKRDGYLLTGDDNLVHMQLNVRYKAREDEQGALDYAFRVSNPEALLQRFVSDAAVKVIAGEAVRDILTEEKQAIQNRIEESVNRKLEQFENKNNFSAGVELVSIGYMIDPQVPLAVQQAFNAAQQARHVKDEMRSEAEDRVASIKQEAEEEKAKLLSEARSYQRRLKVLAEADANTISKLLDIYNQSPVMASILKERQYSRRIEKLLGEHKDLFVLQKAQKGNDNQIQIRITRQREKSEPSEEKQQQQQQGQQSPQGQGGGS